MTEEQKEAYKILINDGCKQAIEESKNIIDNTKRSEFLLTAFNQYGSQLLKLNESAWSALIEIKEDPEQEDDTNSN